jgi:hypothetical protein
MSNRIIQTTQPAPATTYEQQIDVVDVPQSCLQLMSMDEFCQLGVPDLGYVRQGTTLGHSSHFVIFGADGIPLVQTKDLREVMEFAFRNQMMLLPVH